MRATSAGTHAFRIATAPDTRGYGDPAVPGVAQHDAELIAKLDAARRAKPPGYKPRTHHLHEDGSPVYTNRLILETSPYLLQHAHNPVNWYAWGDEAFERAARENKPVLLSVGYSTCHWCHVMERESFEDEEIATFLNEHFISIKVDREERPDVDEVYMTAVQMLTGRGGWPMTVALTPERKPFFGGTYFPPRDGARGARKGFLTILRELSAAYREDPERVLEQAEALSRRIQSAARTQRPADVPDGQALYRAAAALARAFDPKWGGFGRAPKFPRPVTYELLLRYHRRTKDAQALHMVLFSLQKMAGGGMYDHVGGGFHRYSTDPTWLVPHFEKMLYDNAQLASLYLDVYRATGHEDLARVARETLDYVTREMTAAEGGFYSATDADSLTPTGHMEEGWFFTWTPDEIRQALGPERTRVVEAYYAVSERGNVEGRNILHTPRALPEVAESLGMTPQALRSEIDAIREALYRVREQRAPPLRDDKIITAWNGLMISAFVRGASILERPDYGTRARRAASFVLERMRDTEGRLYRSFKDGHARHLGYLDDYAFFIQGLLDLYETTFEIGWLDAAISLQKVLDNGFFDTESGGYFMTSHDHETLIARDKPVYDGAEPSGNSVALMNLLRLEELTTEDAYRQRAEASFEAFGGRLARGSTSAPKMLAALDYYLDEPLEILIVATPDDTAIRGELLDRVRKAYIPNRILSVVEAGRTLSAQAERIPLLGSKVAIDDRTTAYVCKKGYCKRPTSDADELARQLAEAPPVLPGGEPPALPSFEVKAEPKPWQYDPATNRHWHPLHRHWHDGRPPQEPR